MLPQSTSSNLVLTLKLSGPLLINGIGDTQTQSGVPAPIEVID